MPTTTWGTVLKKGARLSKQSEQNLNTLLNGSTELDDVARALNMLDVESQEGIIKAAVKPVVHSFMEAGRFSENQPSEEETEEPDEQSGEEEEEHGPPLEETMTDSESNDGPRRQWPQEANVRLDGYSCAGSKQRRCWNRSANLTRQLRGLTDQELALLIVSQVREPPRTLLTSRRCKTWKDLVALRWFDKSWQILDGRTS